MPVGSPRPAATSSPVASPRRPEWFFSGREALKEVANRAGIWNWVLVGPDEKGLPLAGGGSGSIEEMQNCIAEGGHPVLYGLLRLGFLPDDEVDPDGRMATKFVFIQALGAAVNKGTKVADRTRLAGQVTAKRPMMEKAFSEFVTVSKAILVNNYDMEVAEVIAQLQKASTADKNCICVPYFESWLHQHLKNHQTQEQENLMAIVEADEAEVPDLGFDDADTNTFSSPDSIKFDGRPVELQISASASVGGVTVSGSSGSGDLSSTPVGTQAEAAEGRQSSGDTSPASPGQDTRNNRSSTVWRAAPNGQVDTLAGKIFIAPIAEEQASPEQDQGDEEGKRQRRKIKIYKKGEQVMVYSTDGQKWYDDGLIVAQASESGTFDGYKLPAGCMKARYNGGLRYKWFTPASAAQYLKPSPRPIHPTGVFGEVYRAKHDFTTKWEFLYFEVQEGCVQWGADKHKFASNSRLCLYGLKTQITTEDTKCQMKLQTTSSKGVVHTLKCKSPEETMTFHDALKLHAKYCEQVMGYRRLRRAAEQAERDQKLDQESAEREESAECDQKLDQESAEREEFAERDQKLHQESAEREESAERDQKLHQESAERKDIAERDQKPDQDSAQTEQG